jgi:hypothetical protein
VCWAGRKPRLDPVPLPVVFMRLELCPLADYISLQGPIEREASGLVLRIPLDAGGDELHLVCEQISHIDGDDLVVSIPDWLAKETNLAEDTLVIVDSRDGKLNITKAPVE